MKTVSSQGSAKIYMFPVTVAARAQAARRDAELAKSQRVVSGDGWYHEAAIREDQKRR